MLNFCPKCGNKLYGDRFCANCGADLSKYGAGVSSTVNANAIDDMIGNVMDYTREQQGKEGKLRTLIIRGMNEEAKKYCNELIDKDAMDKVGYIGLIRIASKNYKEYESVEIAKQIRIAEEIFGGDELLIDSDYADYISARNQYFEEKERKRKEAEQAESRKFWVQGGRLKSYLGNDQTVKIPEGITSIGEGAFSCNCNIQSVILPESIIEIGERAFNKCESLRSIDFPGRLTSIGNNAFQNCNSLLNISFPNSLKEIGDYAFAFCANIKSVQLGNGVKKIGKAAFTGCRNIDKIGFPNSVERIEEYAFSDCISLKEFRFPDNLSTVSKYILANCSAIENIVVPNSVNVIEKGAFMSCQSLKSITLPFVGGGTFSDNLFCYIFGGESGHEYVPRTLKTVTITGGKTIGEEAFEECNSIESIVLPNGIESIGYRAFYNCSCLKYINMPDSIRKIGGHAFLGTALEYVTLPSGAVMEKVLGAENSFPNSCRVIRK